MNDSLKKRKNKKHKKDKEAPSFKIPKQIILGLKILQIVSPHLAFLFAKRLFFMPIKYKTPKRELSFEKEGFVRHLNVKDKTISVFKSGQGQKKVLFIHGWSGRGTQCFALRNALLKEDIELISFTAPAHGNNPGKSTHMLEFVESVQKLNQIYGPFDTLIGHSLGGVAALNAIQTSVTTKGIVLIGVPGTIRGVIDDFCERLQLHEQVAELLDKYLKKNYGENLEHFGAEFLCQHMDIPGLIIHDSDDADVDIEKARINHRNWPRSTYLETSGLGHRRILSDDRVIQEILHFIHSTNPD